VQKRGGGILEGILLKSMTNGMTEVERLAESGLVRILFNDIQKCLQRYNRDTLRHLNEEEYKLGQKISLILRTFSESMELSFPNLIKVD